MACWVCTGFGFGVGGGGVEVGEKRQVFFLVGGEIVELGFWFESE